ncbi:hypothetical protein IEQ34_005387 [Dendrobium chrysotoxum]|uniref:LOB domain-containing protein n=1 Tax=Dendrobium chrysotoxum TaxID=161865 RepID=A0AAV7GUW3_DENCH|nr:hypothetical protein IEQ34_005387 [Dendrobium chrysotoxum]
MSSINGGRRCAACKYLRRRCSEDCILAPYFHPSNPYRFACVHKIFGASNIARMLQHLPVHKRAQAADAMAWEAYWRVQDPVYGSNAIIAHLQHEISKAQNELEMTRAQIAILQTFQQHHNQTQPNQQLQAFWALEDKPLFLPDLPHI